MGPSRYWWSLFFTGKPLTGIHRATCPLLQLVHTNIPSGDLISSRLDGLPGRSSAARFRILGRTEEYFVSTGIKTEVWNEKLRSLFLKPQGFSCESVLMTLGPKRRPRNKPRMSGKQHNGYSSTAVSALQGNLPSALLEHRQQNMARVMQGPPAAGTLSGKDTISLISWKQFCDCPLAHCCGWLLSHTLPSLPTCRLEQDWERMLQTSVPWLLFKLVCSVVSWSLTLQPWHSCKHHYW